MVLKNAVQKTASVFDGMKQRSFIRNPLMMRKKMTVKDVIFRKDDPDRELLRFELSYDTEWFLLLAALLLLLICLAIKIGKKIS